MILFLKKCGSKICKEPFGVTELTSLIKDKHGNMKVRCPHCKFLNKLGEKQKHKVMLSKP